MSESLGKCAVCGKEAGVLYPLLSGEPAFCSKHHNPKDAGPFGCDFTGPDDFDMPDGPFYGLEVFDRETFEWKDREGVRHKLVDVDDRYLQNIINFLGRRVVEMCSPSSDYWLSVVEFLEGEQKIRVGDIEGGC